MTLKKKILLSCIVLMCTFIISFCIGYRKNLVKIINTERYAVSKGINEFLGRKGNEKVKYSSNNRIAMKSNLDILILKQEYDVTFDPEDETKNTVLKVSEKTNCQKEKKNNMSKDEITKSYEKQGYIVIWDNDMKIEVIKNNYINNPKVDGVFVLKKDKKSDKISVYKVGSDGVLMQTNEQAYKNVSQLKDETKGLLKRGFLVFGSKEDAKKLAGYN